jgi:L-rhamnose mutarotase
MRVCFISRVRPEQLEAYRQAHAAVWPEMLAALRDTGWRDYRLYLSDDGLLVGTVETDSYEAAQARMAATAINARWQGAMAQFFGASGQPDSHAENNPNTRPDEQMIVLEEIFNLDQQLAALGLPTSANEGEPQ